MVEFTSEDKGKLIDEMLNISFKLNSDIIDELENSCSLLTDLFDDISFGSNECEKLRNMNSKVTELQSRTNQICDEIKNIINSY